MNERRPRTNPFVGVLPESLRLGPLAAAMGALVKSVAWELGERYDAILRHRIGDDWLVELARERAVDVPTLHDPSFVFSEAENHADSPVWLALPPRNVEVVERLRRARLTRNRWEHQPTSQNHETFLVGVDRFLDLSSTLGLASARHCEALRARVLELRRRGGVLAPEDDLDKLRDLLDQARRQREEAAVEAARQASLAGRAGEDAEAARAEIEALREAVLLAQAEVDRLQRMDQAERQRRRLTSEEAEVGVQPGEDWDLPQVGARVVTLKPRLVDMYDPELGNLLSEEMGPIAVDAARRWLTLMPRGGPVHLTEAGHAAARVDGRFVYLGRLDPVVRGFTPGAPALGPWVPGLFMLTAGGDVVELDNERSLGQERPQALEEITSLLSRHIEVEVPFRLTEQGTVVVERDGQWVQVVEIPKGLWFS